MQKEARIADVQQEAGIPLDETDMRALQACPAWALVCIADIIARAKAAAKGDGNGGNV